MALGFNKVIHAFVSFQAVYKSFQFFWGLQCIFGSPLCNNIYEKELSAITLLFNFHEGTVNTQHERESAT